jgi:hypothetical protein
MQAKGHGWLSGRALRWVLGVLSILLASVVIAMVTGSANNSSENNLPRPTSFVVIGKEAVRYHARGLGMIVYLLEIKAIGCVSNCPTNWLDVPSATYSQTKVGSDYRCQGQSC